MKSSSFADRVKNSKPIAVLDKIDKAVSKRIHSMALPKLL